MSLTSIASMAAILSVAGCSIADEPSRLHTDHAPPVSSGGVTVLDRQALLPTFPCSRCHAARAPDARERRLTEFHTQKVLNHGEERGWCYRCHTPDDIDHLHLQDGTRVTFNQAYELCGSCHGDKLRDWRAGIHGLTTGYWLGDRERRSCPACHDPHNPRFPLMTPERAPARPRTAPVGHQGVREESDGHEN